MKWTEAKVIFDYKDKEAAADLISDIFNQFGLQGVVIEDPDEEPAEGWGDGAVEKPANNSVTGFFPPMQASQINVWHLKKSSKSLKVSWVFPGI